jgi:hypothetical protein
MEILQNLEEEGTGCYEEAFTEKIRKESRGGSNKSVL